MMAAIVRSKLWFAGKVDSSLPNLSKKEGAVIGGALAATMISVTNPESAVDEWIVGCRALKEFDRQYRVWFRPMMNTIAKRILGEVGWGLKVGLG